MNVLNGYCQCYRLIDNPCDVKGCFALCNHYGIVVCLFLFACLYVENALATDGLLHILKTKITRHDDVAFNAQLQRKYISYCLAYRHGGVHAAAVYFGIAETLEEVITNSTGERLLIFSNCLQVDFQGLKTGHLLAKVIIFPQLAKFFSFFLFMSRKCMICVKACVSEEKHHEVELRCAFS